MPINFINYKIQSFTSKTQLNCLHNRFLFHFIELYTVTVKTSLILLCDNKIIIDMSFAAYCSKCYAEHFTNKPSGPFEKCTRCGQFNGLRFKPIAEQPFTAYCQKCYAQFKTHSPSGPFEKCLRCNQFNGLRFKKEAPKVASCSKCYTVYKTHTPSGPFQKCLNCGQFNGLRFK